MDPQTFPRVHYSPDEIELAKTWQASGLIWIPSPGDFVYDNDNVLPHTSPFQPHVFFILDIAHFVRYAGSVEAIAERMFWLPTYEQAREWLIHQGITAKQIAEWVTPHVERRTERLRLYHAITTLLQIASQSDAI